MKPSGNKCIILHCCCCTYGSSVYILYHIYVYTRVLAIHACMLSGNHQLGIYWSGGNVKYAHTHQLLLVPPYHMYIIHTAYILLYR